MCKLNNKSQKHFKYYFLNQKKNPISLIALEILLQRQYIFFTKYQS